jgi:hypothetical protein
VKTGSAEDRNINRGRTLQSSEKSDNSNQPANENLYLKSPELRQATLVFVFLAIAESCQSRNGRRGVSLMLPSALVLGGFHA